MVRFIIDRYILGLWVNAEFTFQYGQIYYVGNFCMYSEKIQIYIPIWLDLLFITSPGINSIEYIFTFQYGQIYYLCCQFSSFYDFPIYIPIWLDLLYFLLLLSFLMLVHLHSNMVRFIIRIEAEIKYWHKYLHSNMVRFIMFNISSLSRASNSFTFQYGQIYYDRACVRVSRVRAFTFQYGQIYYDYIPWY